VEAFDAAVITSALAAAAIAKILVDLVRSTQKLPPWASPLLALIAAQGAAFLLLVAAGAVVDAQTASQTVIIGVLAAGTAVGTTELQKREKRDVSKLTAELVVIPDAVAPGPQVETRRDG
jgi:hypothetical protein